MKTTRRLLRFAGLLILLTVGAALLASCDGDEDDTTPTTAPTEAATASPPPEDTAILPPPTDTPDSNGDITPTATAAGPHTIKVTYPEQNQAVPMVTRAEVEVEPTELGDLQVYVLVRPIPEDRDQDYWVQAWPEQNGEGHWVSEPVYVGIESDRSGLPFWVCAILTDEILYRGDRLHNPPDVPTDCVDVTRK